MSTTDFCEQSLGQIAVNLPGSTAVFRRLKLDFCCGGQTSLRQAAQDKGLDLTALEQELRTLERPAGGPSTTETAPLVNHLLERFHQVHRAQLPELIRMARRVEAVHRDHPQAPIGLADHLEQMESELLQHMAKEEQILFPMMLAGNNPFVSQPIGVMRREHSSHGAQLERLQQLAHGAEPPIGACNTWRALYAGITQFSDDLVQHIHLENNVLFPRFEAATSCDSASCGCA